MKVLAIAVFGGVALAPVAAAVVLVARASDGTINAVLIILALAVFVLALGAALGVVARSATKWKDAAQPSHQFDVSDHRRQAVVYPPQQQLPEAAEPPWQLPGETRQAYLKRYSTAVRQIDGVK